jgi:hypothetical protein
MQALEEKMHPGQPREIQLPRTTNHHTSTSTIEDTQQHIKKESVKVHRHNSNDNDNDDHIPGHATSTIRDGDRWSNANTPASAEETEDDYGGGPSD